jgi:cyclopropane-fatty-acyl-phospholipid synthase
MQTIPPHTPPFPSPCRTTYPNLVHFFEENGIEMEPSPLTFSFDFDDTHVPAPTPADLALFEEDVLSFLGGAPQPEVTLGQFLEGRAYSQEFRSAYLVPLCAGIWLSSKEAILGASAWTVLSFLRDHQMLQVSRKERML